MKYIIAKVVLVFALISVPLLTFAAAVPTPTFETGSADTLLPTLKPMSAELQAVIAAGDPADTLVIPDDAFVLDQHYRAFREGNDHGWVALPLGPSTKGPFGIGLAALIFMVYAARKLYLISR